MKKSQFVNMVIVCCLLIVVGTVSGAEKKDVTEFSQEDLMASGWHSEIRKLKSMEDAVQSWRDDGFGVFVGFYGDTVLQGRWKDKEFKRDLWGEWIMKRAGISIPEYEAALKKWNPYLFDAEEWADLFAECGVRYMVYMAKHHDGFAHFKSDVKPYNIVDHCGFPKDPYKELCDAVLKRGIKPGFYYSHGMEWHSPGGHWGPKGRTTEEYFEAVVFPHLKELATKYGPQYVVWFDLGAPKPLAGKCVATLRRTQPHIMVSSRVGGRLGNFSTGGDQAVRATKMDTPWETCMTLTWHWAWYPQDRKHKSASEIIEMLARIRSLGGNMLLNTAIDVRGKIPLRDTIVFKEVGAWMKKNCESIYGVKLTPFRGNLPWGVVTQKPGKLYLHVLEFPSLDTLFLPGVESKIKKAYYLADKKKQSLTVTKVEDGHAIDMLNADLSSDFLDEADTVIVVEYDGELAVSQTPVLDHDLDNRFIPLEAASHKDVSVRGYIRRPILSDHGTCMHLINSHYACKFKSEDAFIHWDYDLTDDNAFWVNIEYANLTKKPIPASLTIGGETIKFELPVTVTHGKDWRWFRRERVGLLRLKAGKGQKIVFKLDGPPPTEEDKLVMVRQEDHPPGKKHEGLMIESVVLKSMYPLPYELTNK